MGADSGANAGAELTSRPRQSGPGLSNPDVSLAAAGARGLFQNEMCLREDVLSPPRPKRREGLGDFDDIKYNIKTGSLPRSRCSL